MRNSRNHEILTATKAHNIEKHRDNTNIFNDISNIILSSIFLPIFEERVSKKIRDEEPRQIEILAGKEILVEYKIIGLPEGCRDIIVKN